MDTNYSDRFVQPTIPPKVIPVCTGIPYGDQRVEGYLGARIALNRNQSMGLFPVEDYLAPYRGDWAAAWPSGEYLGKHLQALVCAYLYDRQDALMDRMSHIVERWHEVIPDDGYLVVKDDPAKARWAGDWEVWELKYELVGLMNYYSITEDPRALEIGRKIGNLLCSVFGDNEGKRDLPSVGALRLGTMTLLEGMVYLYQYSGDERYLGFCEYLMRAHEGPTGTQMLHELLDGAGNVAQIGGNGPQNGFPNQGAWNKGKAYEEMASFVGVLRYYQLTGRSEYLTAMFRAWEDIRPRVTLIGTAAHREYFRHHRHKYGDHGDHLGEGCVTAHWMFFSRILYFLSGELRYIDEIERTVYNALLGSQHPKDARQSYFLDLNGNKAYADFSVNSSGPPCCLTSVQREVARIPETLWAAYGPDRLALLLYNAGTVDARTRGPARGAARGRDGNLTLRLESEFPEATGARLQVLDGGGSLTISLRVPRWARAFEATTRSGEARRTVRGEPGTFVDLPGDWRTGDTVDIRFDAPQVLLDGEDSYPHHHAVLRGVQILGIDEQVAKRSADDFRVATPVRKSEEPGTDRSGRIELTTAREMLPDGWVGTQAYTSRYIAAPDGTPAPLVPFSEIGQLDRSRYRVWIRDSNAPAEIWHRIQDDDFAWVFEGDAGRLRNYQADRGHVARLRSGAAARIGFFGRKVRIVGTRGPWLTTADVFIDDVAFPYEKWIELRWQEGATVFVSPLYELGKHSLEIRAHEEVVIDYLDVMRFEGD